MFREKTADFLAKIRKNERQGKSNSIQPSDKGADCQGNRKQWAGGLGNTWIGKTRPIPRSSSDDGQKSDGEQRKIQHRQLRRYPCHITQTGREALY